MASRGRATWRCPSSPSASCARASLRSSSTIATSVRAAARRASSWIRGGSSTTGARHSPSRGVSPRSTRSASRSGGPRSGRDTRCSSPPGMGRVAQVPQVDSSAEGEATFFGVGWALRLLASAWLDLAAGWLGRPPFEIPAIAPAGGFGMIVDDRAYAAFETLVGAQSLYRNAVAARGILTFDEWNPAESRGKIAAPLLLIASRQDRFAPFSAVESYAAATPNATLAEIEGDHFDVYASPVRERAAELAAVFLARELGR